MIYDHLQTISRMGLVDHEEKSRKMVFVLASTINAIGTTSHSTLIKK